MLNMIAQSAALLVAAFVLFSGLGWLLAGKRRVTRRMSAFNEAPAEIIEADFTPVAKEEAAEVYHYDVAKAAEQFTSGVVVPFKMPTTPEPKAETPREVRPAYVPADPTPRVDVAAARAMPEQRSSLQPQPSQAQPFQPQPFQPQPFQPQAYRLDPNLQGRVSSLAAMTPESVEAAVHQAGSGLEPMRLETPRGSIDDLTVISGIGPGNQQELNALGIFHYWQIAGWTPEHVAWVSNRVRFPKRIVRENWMAQAAKLARMR